LACLIACGADVHRRLPPGAAEIPQVFRTESEAARIPSAAIHAMIAVGGDAVDEQDRHGLPHDAKSQEAPMVITPWALWRLIRRVVATVRRLPT